MQGVLGSYLRRVAQVKHDCCCDPRESKHGDGGQGHTQPFGQAVQDWARLTLDHDPREVALIADASNQEIDRLNVRAQHLRALRGELGEQHIPLTSTHYDLRDGDHVAFIAQHHPEPTPTESLNSHAP
jgi:hypothetical protein